MYNKTIIILLILAKVAVHGAPQFDTLSEVFKSCSDLESDGYEGYRCVSQRSCNEGYIVSNAVHGDLALKQERPNLLEEELDVSNFGCPDRKEQAIRQDYDEYGDYDYYGGVVFPLFYYAPLQRNKRIC